MKYKHLITSLLIGFTSLIYGQASIESIIGISDNGLANQTTFNIEVNQEKAIGLEVGFYLNSNDYEEQNIEIPIDVFVANIGATKQLNFLSTDSKSITTRIIGGLSLGAEVLNDGNKELENGALLANSSGIIFGGYLGASTAFKINQKFSAVVRYTNFFHNSDISPTRFIVGAGLRYNF